MVLIRDIHIYFSYRYSDLVEKTKTSAETFIKEIEIHLMKTARQIYRNHAANLHSATKMEHEYFTLMVKKTTSDSSGLESHGVSASAPEK